MTAAHAHVRPEGARSAPPASGLVEQVTTHTVGHLSKRDALNDLNHERRIKRMRRVVVAGAEAARWVLSQGGNRYVAVLVTLTYRDDAEWRACDIAGYIKAVRQWASRRGIRARYQWVLELTQRGRPHYHVLVWLPRGYSIPKPDRSGSWDRGFSRVERARNAVGYLVKYATKGDLDRSSLPRGARLCGTGGGGESEKLATHRAGLARWLDSSLPEGWRVSRIARVGWVHKPTGEVFRSPFEFRVERDEWGIIVLVFTYREEVTLCAS